MTLSESPDENLLSPLYLYIEVYARFPDYGGRWVDVLSYDTDRDLRDEADSLLSSLSSAIKSLRVCELDDGAARMQRLCGRVRSIPPTAECGW